MKKIISIIFAIIASLLAVSVGYAQNGVAVTPTAGTIRVNQQSIAAPASAVAGVGDNISWGGADTGSLTFPSGHIIRIGNERQATSLPSGYTSEIEVLDVAAGATQNTRIRLISGCSVIEVPATATNPLVIVSDNGNNSVRIRPTASALVCQDSQGNLTVTRLGGDGQIEVLSGNVVIVSNVVTTSSASCTIPVLNPSGVGIGFIPCP